MCCADQPEPTSLDTSAPILAQVGKLGSAYQCWVHRPVKGAPRFFSSPVLEGITKTSWWVVPAVWGPTLCCLCWLTYGLALPWLPKAGLVCCGWFLWQLIEYSLHRYAFHAQAQSHWAITVHFLFHGCHHKFPNDPERLVFPPLPAAAIAAAIWGVLRCQLPHDASLCTFTGIIAGYLAYDCTHFALHHWPTSRWMPWMAQLRRTHLRHHFADHQHSFGISSPLVDLLLNSRPPGPKLDRVSSSKLGPPAASMFGWAQPVSEGVCGAFGLTAFIAYMSSAAGR